ncbi:MAG: Rossmann-like domain-containing protein, partial [Dehalococcoidales bacterium]
PAILENLVLTFGADNVRCTDLNPNNTGTKKYGAEIWDGRIQTERLIKWCDLVLATSSTIINNTFDEIREKANVQGKRLIIFGVTGTGVSALLGLERV